MFRSTSKLVSHSVWAVSFSAFSPAAAFIAVFVIPTIASLTAFRSVAGPGSNGSLILKVEKDQTVSKLSASPASPPPFLHIPSYPGTRITCLHAPHDTKGAPGGGWFRLEQLGHAMTGGIPSADGASGKATTW
jgi:hypothetical protein